MRPIRSQHHREVTHDPWEHAVRPLGQHDEVHVLGDAGGVESYTTSVLRPCDCGCLRPPGGYCSVCGALACASCFGHCCQCLRPVCPRHSAFVEAAGISPRLCPGCRDATVRKQRLSRVCRLLLSPFIEFGRRG